MVAAFAVARFAVVGFELAVLFAVVALAAVRLAAGFAAGLAVVARFAAERLAAGAFGSFAGAVSTFGSPCHFGISPSFSVCGLLRLVGVLGARVHLELAEHRSAERVLREHAADGLLDGEHRPLVEQLAVPRGREAARVARVPIGDLRLALAAGDLHVLRR